MEEPSFLLRATLWHFGSGDAFFVGWGLMFLAIVLRIRGASTHRMNLLGLLGLIWVCLTDAFSLHALIQLAILFLLIVVTWWLSKRKTTRLSPSLWLVAILIVAVCGMEVPYHLPIRPTAPDAGSVAIIGDSVTAGLNAGDHTWPRQLAEATGRTVYEASQQGATVKSAITQLEKLDGRGDVLWIEIGGNDILESLPPHVYAEQLDQLLAAATKRYSKIMLMEIPAPPGGGRYVYDQRRLATKYHLPLVPKRQLLSVLTSKGSTQDGVHLANAGHERMARVVRKNLGWQERNTGKMDGRYIRCE